MADSITEVGTTPFFPMEPNWVRRPKVTQHMSRLVHQREGTVDEIEVITPDVPIKMEMGFTIFSKEDEYTILDFFVSRKGMVEKFWIPWPKQQFYLNRDHNVGEITLDCDLNFAERQYQYYERIEILMNNGDRIIRRIANAFGDDTETNLQLDTSLDRDLGQNDYLRISRLLLVRFDTDDLDLTAVTNVIGEINLPFLELVHEYDEV